MTNPVVFVDLDDDGQIIFLVHGIETSTVDDFIRGTLVYPGPVFGRDAEIGDHDAVIGRRIHTWGDAMHIHMLDPLTAPAPWDGWETRTTDMNMWAASETWTDLGV